MRRSARVPLLGMACVAGLLAAGLLVAPVQAMAGTGADDPLAGTGERLITDGVTIAGQPVGGLTAAEARAAVERRFGRTLRIATTDGWGMRVRPAQLGAKARIGKAVQTALGVLTPGFNVPLTVDVNDAVLARFVSKLERKTERAPRDGAIRLRKLEPVFTPPEPGRRLKALAVANGLRLALRKHDRADFELPFATVKPLELGAGDGQAIVILRESKVLRLYQDGRLKRTFRVATGQSAYPTPVGRWEIVTMQRNPWWYPPQGSDWARGKEPVPPGPGNPLGTRWMGLSAPLVGIHGTPDAASIGYSASHGCIRMLIPSVEWLFERVGVGTPVFILRA
ncbi:MAG: L,D-transpeptidase family protein [Gaiella sp.]